MKRSFPILLLLGVLLCSCKPSDSHVTDVGMNQVLDGDYSDLSLDEIVEQLPRVGSEGRWDEEKEEYIEHPACIALRERLGQGHKLTDAQWRKALIDTGVIRIRRRWPEGEDLALSMRMPRWLGVSEIRMKPRSEGLQEAKAGMLFDSDCGTYCNWVYQAALCQRLGRLPLGSHKIVSDVVVERGEEISRFRFREEKAPKPPPPGVLWKGEMSFDVEVVKSIDDCVSPVKNEALDEAVRNSLGVAFSEWYIEEKMQPTAIFVIDPDVEGFPEIADTALSLKIEILKEGRVVDECHLTASAYDPLAVAASVKDDCQSIGFCRLASIPADLKDNKEDRKKWSIRVSGTSKDVVYLWEAKRRWGGSVEMPIDELIERERERTKGKERVWVWTPTLR